MLDLKTWAITRVNIFKIRKFSTQKKKEKKNKSQKLFKLPKLTIFFFFFFEEMGVFGDYQFHACALTHKTHQLRAENFLSAKWSN